MNKNCVYVLDTNVLLHDPRALFSFEEHTVVVPISVIEELDKFKSDPGQIGRNARETSRLIESLRTGGNLGNGVRLPNGGTLFVLLDPLHKAKPTNRTGRREVQRQRSFLGQNGADKLILETALHLKHINDQKGINTVVVSKDINLRIRADALSIMAEDYKSDNVPPETLPTGISDMVVESDVFESIKTTERFELKAKRTPNKYFVVSCDEILPHKKTRPIYMKVDPSGERLVKIIDSSEGIWGIKPRNRQQVFAFDALLNEEVRLVTLMGKAGTGKTLMAMAAGLKLTINDGAYRRLIITRPTISVGKEIGFLPGSLEEKLAPWMQPIHDALELLSDMNMGSGLKLSDLMRSGKIMVEALSYIRGRSIANQFMIVDEAQNLTPLEVKTIVTRVGPGTKIIFTGDPGQIDNPNVNKDSNGFIHLVKKFWEEKISATIELIKGERSELAELAAQRL